MSKLKINKKKFSLSKMLSFWIRRAGENFFFFFFKRSTNNKHVLEKSCALLPYTPLQNTPGKF